MAIDESRDCDNLSRDDFHCIQGWRLLNLEMTIDASQDGDRSFPGWLSMHPGMAYWEGVRSIPGYIGWQWMHPGW